MFLESIENITKFEEDCKERKAASEAQARQIIQDAAQDGQDLLRKVRTEAAENAKKLLCQAESKAAEKSEAIRIAAENEIAAMRAYAAGKLDEAADFIVGRVVNN